VADADLAERIAARAAAAGVAAGPPLADGLAVYLALLAHWNRTINLTGFKLTPPADEAIDRLIVEPLVAAQHVRSSEHAIVDIGSGGGSPALPMKLALPDVRFVLVESKVRKAAFLREAVRHLGLDRVAVENRRLEELVAGDRLPAANIATVRAVRLDASVVRTIKSLLADDGRIFLFGPAVVPSEAGEGRQIVPLGPRSALEIIQAEQVG
jgi:16S rRNA (guanine527-N7)-methyltransferase